jgi:hypothetical protein
MWRLFEDNPQIDYTLLRHLHDLYALSEYCSDKDIFAERVLRIFESKDCKRIEGEVSFANVVRSTCGKLNNGRLYKAEYGKYVESMSYAHDNERISYDAVLSNLNKIAEYFI